MAIWKIGSLAAAAVLGSGLLIGQASAMPANRLATVASDVSDSIHDCPLGLRPLSLLVEARLVGRALLRLWWAAPLLGMGARLAPLVVIERARGLTGVAGKP